MDAALKIVVIDESPARAAIIADGLNDAGFTNVARIADTENLVARICSIDPDVVMIDLANPSDVTLAQMFDVCRAIKLPVAIFVGQSNTAAIEGAVDAGVSAFVVDGLKKERIKAILDLCISRHKAFARLRAELAQAKVALGDRKVIDRAKGILMKAKKLSEDSAYALLRKTAMNENKKVVDVAQSVITAAEMFK